MVQRMLPRLRHRGPDDEGVYVAHEMRCVLGHRRLAIIDLLTGHQPIANEDGTIQVVLNGEIYNYRELRRELEERGHRFGTKSDTEVIAHAYEQFGQECVRRLEGMFAFALWDERRGQLVLATDKYGKKPIYYWAANGALTFGSEVDALVSALDRRPMIDVEALRDYLALGWIRAPRSIYCEIRRLPPATVLVWRDGTAATSTYWDFPPYAPQDRSPGDEAAELQAILSESVRKRLVSDVPLGAFLSAGTDSTVVVALMRRLQSGPVRTFTIGFEGDPESEHEWALRIAAYLGTDHQQEIITSAYTPLLRELCGRMGEPLGDPSLLPTFLVSRLARRDVTVALSGDGGDEMFGGYSRYRKMLLAQWLRPLARTLWSALPLVGRALLQRWVVAVPALAARELDELYLRLYGGVLFTLADHQAVGARMEQLRRWMQAGGFDARLGGARGSALVPALQAWDVASYLSDDILTKVDRASMLVSLEVRCPLLDPAVAQFTRTLPARRITSLRRGKVALRGVLDRLLPPSLVPPGKRGFAPSRTASPLREWGRVCVELLQTPESLTRLALGDEMTRQIVGRIRGSGGAAWWPAFALFALEAWFAEHRTQVDVGDETTREIRVA